MRLSIGSDHAGFELKGPLAQWLSSALGGRHRVKDVGTSTTDSCDYPDFALKVAHDVAKGRAARGILVCGTGIGMAITANKVRGVRAAVAWNPASAHLASEHNDANILCIPGRFVSLKKAQAMAKEFLTTRFAGGRHRRRIRKIIAIDKKC